MSSCKTFKLQDGSRRLIKAYRCRIRTMSYGYRLYLLHGRPLDLTAPTRLESQRLLADFLQPDLMELSQYASNQIKPPAEVLVNSDKVNSNPRILETSKCRGSKGFKPSIYSFWDTFYTFFLSTIYSNNNVFLSLRYKLLILLLNFKKTFLSFWTEDILFFCPKPGFSQFPNLKKWRTKRFMSIPDTVKIDLTSQPTTVKVKPKGA